MLNELPSQKIGWKLLGRNIARPEGATVRADSKVTSAAAMPDSRSAALHTDATSFTSNMPAAVGRFSGSANMQAATSWAKAALR
mmetsp:Transcript_1347/g.1832  ORF Transcript_1347/g.1832 Transcript_1347/m.1832 type:complete len:84 (-) Transcript_1347:3443-3694(-)